MNASLENRELGQQVPVSIPTAIPFEEVVLKEDGEKGEEEMCKNR